MSLLFFLKPVFRRVVQAIGTPPKPKKKKVYEVVYEKKTAHAKSADLTGWAKSLFEADRKKKREKAESEDLVMLNLLFDDAI